MLLPRAVVPWLSQSRDPAKLDRSQATLLYARAIAQGLELDATQKRILLDAATHLGDAKRLTRIEDFERVMQTVLYCRERWDGEGGFPGVLSGDAIPLESRVLAVAERLAAMTAVGNAGLSPRAGDRRAGAARRRRVRPAGGVRRALGDRGGRDGVAAAPAAAHAGYPRRLALESTIRSNPLHTKPISSATSSARSAFGF